MLSPYSRPNRRRQSRCLAFREFTLLTYQLIQCLSHPQHCHIAWHVSAGLYINIFERPNDIKEKALPGVVAQTCTDWSAYTSRNVVEQIDSGERV